MEKIRNSPSHQNWPVISTEGEVGKLNLLKQSIQLFEQAWQNNASRVPRPVFKAEVLLTPLETSLEGDSQLRVPKTAQQVHAAFIRQLVCLGLDESDENLVTGMGESPEGQIVSRAVYEAIARSGKVGNPKKIIRYLLLADKVEECRPLFQIFNTTLEAEDLSAWKEKRS